MTIKTITQIGNTSIEIDKDTTSDDINFKVNNGGSPNTVMSLGTTAYSNTMGGHVTAQDVTVNGTLNTGTLTSSDVTVENILYFKGLN